MKNEIVFYQSDEIAEHIEVRIENDMVWLNRHQMAALFCRDIKTIGKHINHIFIEGELNKNPTVAYFATVQNEGGRNIERQLEFYNLDVIISVGYRVKSKQGTQFRIWATNVLRNYLLKGYAISQRVDKIEANVDSLSNEVNRISLQLKSNELPLQGIFFDGQIFDAYVFVANLIKKANKEIILLDNYIDESVLLLLSKRKLKVKALIYTQSISKQLQLDLEKHNSQYPPITIIPLVNSHDRFIIIDHKELYHIGASLKDLGKKWFAFSRMDVMLPMLLEQLNTR